MARAAVPGAMLPMPGASPPFHTDPNSEDQSEGSTCTSPPGPIGAGATRPAQGKAPHGLAPMPCCIHSACGSPWNIPGAFGGFFGAVTASSGKGMPSLLVSPSPP